jgi:hypothetical protein
VENSYVLDFTYAELQVKNSCMLDFADAALVSKISYAYFGELEDQPFLKRSTLKDAVTKGTQDMPNIQVERESGSRCQSPLSELNTSLEGGKEIDLWSSSSACCWITGKT